MKNVSEFMFSKLLRYINAYILLFNEAFLSYVFINLDSHQYNVYISIIEMKGLNISNSNCTYVNSES